VNENTVHERERWDEAVEWVQVRGHARGLWEKEWDAADVDVTNFCNGLCSLVLHPEVYVVLNFFYSFIPSLQSCIENAEVNDILVYL
jgi:hypothetical protein